MMDKNKISVLIAAALAGIPAIHSQSVHNLHEVVVTARRPASEIGIQKTTLDSLALKENIALSMADILTFNSSVFVKSYGRATLSTVAFRGTSPSHTQVTWNGMKINSPMLGMTDFSTIPSYFIDSATLLHGTSSVNETGGGLGGLVRLGTLPDAPKGFGAQYVQGIGSFSTFDQFGRFTYASEHWTTSTRAVYSTSPNDYKYINHDKKENIYDENNNIIGSYHPTERNRSGAFHDFHILHETFFNSLRGDRAGLSVWYTRSNRELPLLTTDYADDTEFENRQRENTLRASLSWDHFRDKWKLAVKGGYIHSWLAYDYNREVAPGQRVVMTRSRSTVNTFFALADGQYSPSRHWVFNAGVSLHQHFVRSEDRSATITTTDGTAIAGYDRGRPEFSASASAKWQPTDRIGLSAVLRQDVYADKAAPVIPAFFIDGIISRRANVTLRASVSRNHRFPSLNDLYFLPGGNPNLKSEHGISYDAGASFATGIPGILAIDGSASWFDSRISDWIIWLPTTKGFFSPRNIRRVHAYGVELKTNISIRPHRDWLIDLNGSYSWTPSINHGDKMSAHDKSVGKQLPYVPRHSANITGRLSWGTWAFLYKWCFYSRRYTMSSNDISLSGYLPEYFMSNISLEKGLSFKPLDLQLKLAVNNLFNEDYLSVLSHPMPGINFEFFISITPHFRSRK